MEYTILCTIFNSMHCQKKKRILTKQFKKLNNPLIQAIYFSTMVEILVNSQKGAFCCLNCPFMKFTRDKEELLHSTSVNVSKVTQPKVIFLFSVHVINQYPSTSPFFKGNGTELRN